MTAGGAGAAGARQAGRVLTWGTVTLGPGRPAVAVSLTGPGLAQAQAQAARAAGAGADVLELRVDLLEDVPALLAGGGDQGRAPEGEPPAAGDAPVAGALPGGPDSALALRADGRAWQAAGADGSVRAAAQAVLDAVGAVSRAAEAATQAAGGPPLLLTCRSAAEGGRAEVDDVLYEALLLAVVEGLPRLPAAARPAALDVEVGRGCLERLARAAHAVDVDVVGSFHSFTSTPADAVLEDVLARTAAQGADLVKVAVWPTDAADVARLLALTARARLPVPLASMSMGALGAVSRVAAVFGSALTFAVVPDEHGEIQASAPGQLPLAEVRRCLALLGGGQESGSGAVLSA